MESPQINVGIEELTFSLFQRPLHPELFQIYASRRLKTAKYEAMIWVTGCTHVVSVFTADACMVEIVNAPYIRGNVTFGGIISLISSNNDLGYIDLPSSGLLVDYQMLDPWLADGINSGLADSRLPDVRNTLYWNPGMDLQSELMQTVSFYASDLMGEYEVLIRGIDSKGKYFSKTVPFRVE